MSSLYFMTIICDRNQTRRCLAFYKEHGVSVTFQALGRGTAASEILDSFGLEASEKAMLFSVVTDSEWRELKRGLETQIKIDIPGTGIAFIVPLSSIGGGRQLQFLIEGREFKKGEESALKDTKYELLVEESIRIASSLCARLAKAKMEAEIISNGRDAETGEPLSYRLPAGAAQIQVLNQKLARLITGERDIMPMEEIFRREKASAGSGRTCIMISKNRTPELEKELSAAVREGIGVLWVLPVRPGADGEKNEIPAGLTVLRWEAGNGKAVGRNG